MAMTAIPSREKLIKSILSVELPSGFNLGGFEAELIADQIIVDAELPPLTTCIYDGDGNFKYHEPHTCGDHRTVGDHRSWCYQDGEWCYPSIPCVGCGGS